MGDGSMFEQPDFGRAQSAEGDAYQVDDEDDAYDEDDEDGIPSGVEVGVVDDDVEVVLAGNGADEDTEDLEDFDEVLQNELDSDNDLDDFGDPSHEDDEDDEDDLENPTVNRIHGAAARAVLEHITRTLVDDPDSVVVDVSEGRSGLRFSVHVAQGDMGRLIGRKGRTAQAIRALVRAAAASDGTEASVDIVD